MSTANSIIEEPEAAGSVPARWVWPQVGAAIWAALIVYAFLTIWNASWLALWPLVTIVLVPFLVWSMTFLHELGHALAAKLCGWRVIAFAAGPIGFHAVNGQFAFIPSKKRTELEGFVMPSPSSASVWTREREALIDFGGPLANLVIAAAFLTDLIDWRAQFFSERVDIPSLAFAVGLISLATALHSLTPIFDHARRSDGDNILLFIRGGDPEELRWRAIARLHALANYGLRLRELPNWMVEEARTRAPGDPEIKRAYDALKIGMVLDSPPLDIPAVRRLLDEFRSNYGASDWLDSCDAYFAAVWERDAAQARLRLWQGEVSDGMRPLALAADAAVLAIEGDPGAPRVMEQMRDAVAQKSIFPDLTFRDIGFQIEALIADGRKFSPGASAG